MISFQINFHQNIFPFITLEENEVYYCPGLNVDNNVNLTALIVRVSNYDV